MLRLAPDASQIPPHARFAAGGIFVNMGSFRFCFALSTRAHGVPFLHTSGAHLTTPFHGAIAVGAMLPPTPPSDIFPCRIA